MVSYRGILALTTLLIAVGLTAIGARGQGASDKGASNSGPVTAATSTAATYVYFQAVGTGNETDSSGGCPDVTCPSGHDCDCINWTALPFSSTALGSGTFTAQLNLNLTDQSGTASIDGKCYPVAGVGKLSTGANAAMAINIAGTACDVASPNSKLQFSGSYTVTGGTGPYASSNGVGSATATMVDQTGTFRVAWTLIGTIHK